MYGFIRKMFVKHFENIVTKRQSNKNTLNKKVDKSNKRVFRQKSTRQKVVQNTDFGFIKN